MRAAEASAGSGQRNRALDKREIEASSFSLLPSVKSEEGEEEAGHFCFHPVVEEKGGCFELNRHHVDLLELQDNTKVCALKSE